jgi:predicted secreted protein with PEFG-CTERM motif
MIFTLFGILIMSVGTTTAFGQNESIILNIDKTSYLEGETISISGEIKNMIASNQISLIIQSPNGNLVALDQMTVGSDKQFSTEIKLGGKLMKQEGTYTIKVQYGEQSITTSFEFGGVIDVPENALEETIVEDTVEDIVEDIVMEDSAIVDSIVTATTLTIQDSTDLILYEITNGKITNVIPDLDAVSLLIDIEAIDDGSITLTIPRSVLDATINDNDDEFFVLVDGEEVDFEEITTSTDRTLTIEFLAGSEQIEIIGTFVIPEFGTIAAMILAVAIISIIAISAKSRLSIPSRY